MASSATAGGSSSTLRRARPLALARRRRGFGDAPAAPGAPPATPAKQDGACPCAPLRGRPGPEREREGEGFRGSLGASTCAGWWHREAHTTRLTPPRVVAPGLGCCASDCCALRSQRPCGRPPQRLSRGAVPHRQGQRAGTHPPAALLHSPEQWRVQAGADDQRLWRDAASPVSRRRACRAAPRRAAPRAPVSTSVVVRAVFACPCAHVWTPSYHHCCGSRQGHLGGDGHA